MLCVSGKAIAETIKEQLRIVIHESNLQPRLGIIYVGSDPVIDNFIQYKKKFGDDIGAQVQVFNFPDTTTTDAVITAIVDSADDLHGIIVQLPLPDHLDRRSILDAIPAGKDIDVLSTRGLELFSANETTFFPPVAGAVSEIVKNHDVEFRGKQIVLVGEGLLVGDPTKRWLERENYSFDVINLGTGDAERRALLSRADVIITGVGSPHLITPDLVRYGVVLIDAGTSEAGKRLRGDIHPDCAAKSSIFTPVPGGVGPLTIAVLYRNLISGIIG